MSRLTDLLGQLAESSPALADDLRRETAVLAARRPFGLNFERHVPETVEMYGRKIRRGDKVRLRPLRGSLEQPDKRTWVVVGFAGAGAERQARLVLSGNAEEPDTATQPVSDLVVIADFREPIYPGLRPTGKIEAGGEKPVHVVINGENFHALEALTFAYRGTVDCIYIDPPYNSRDKDWKYNNDYVDQDDEYRHSKWLAMMERRLAVAKELLNPADSALIVTIDEREYLRMGLLLEQVFPEARVQMVSSVINPAGTGRQNEFSRTNEYIFFLQFGALVIQPMLPTDRASVPVEWEPFRRRDLQSRRGTPKGGRAQFYPIYVDRTTGLIVGTGEPLPPDQDRHTAATRDGCASVFPVREDGTEMNWSLTRDEFERRLASGYVRVGRHQPDGPQEYVISYLRTGPIRDIESGRAVVVSKNADGSVMARYPEGKSRMPLTQWDFPSHDAQRYGTTLLQSFIPGRRFPFPKALYAVEDVLRIAVAHKPRALVLDFFAGSGTTAHAVMRLNKQDDGQRRAVLVTNNEVSADEAASLRSKGLAPGDPDWEALGICEYITKPRISAAISGKTPEGDPVKGDYKFIDECAMAEGFEENAEFFDLIYEDPERVRYGMGFEAVAPLLWFRAGCEGARVDVATDSYAISETYAVLFSLDAAAPFIGAVRDSAKRLRLAYVVTDDEAQFQIIARQLPSGVESVRLYSAYLDNAKIVVRE